VFEEFSEVDWCRAMLNVEHQGTQFVLDAASSKTEDNTYK